MSKGVILAELKNNMGRICEDSSMSPVDKKEGTIGIISRFFGLDGLNKKRNTSESSPITNSSVAYYGVYIPSGIKKGPDEEALHVYEKKTEALELVKKYKLARFKAFPRRQDAISFALRGAEPTDTTDSTDSCPVSEKPYPFKAPSPQDMVSLRKAIEGGLETTVRDRVWDNPRFLISNGNTPAIMQEGSRYNALHVAAKSMNADISNLILTTVGNPTFVQTLYGLDADPGSCKEFASILVDRYLNTPDKAMNETPLHFAAKYGAEQVVDVLTSFPQCNKAAVNKFGEQPKDIICKRSSNSTPETCQRIAVMLQERFYVPVLHTEDDSHTPTIGRPFTPSQHPEMSCHPLSPRYEIRAFAGPMDAVDANQFMRKWKSRPRRTAGALAPPNFRLKEITKGLETVGRDLAEQLHVGWKEYWPFLDTFTDLRTPEGLQLLENYLKNKYEDACSLILNETCVPNQTLDDLTVSRLSLGNISASPIKNTLMSPISELCVAMSTCTISNNRPVHWRRTDPLRQRLARQPSKVVSNLATDSTPPLCHTMSQTMHIERACQVYATRIVDALNFSLTAEPEVAGESLRSEAKHLQHTIYNFMDDERFQDMNFSLVHSRMAQLVVYKLKEQTKDLNDVNVLIGFLQKLCCPNDDTFSSDDEMKSTSCRDNNKLKWTRVIDGHVRCLSSFICEELNEGKMVKGPSSTDSECVQIWEKASKCECNYRIESKGNIKKNSSFRKNRSSLSTSPRTESNFARRLMFDHEFGDGKLRNECEDQPSLTMNSPSGDSGAPKLYTIDVAKCQVVSGELSDDDSDCKNECSDEEVYVTASEYSSCDSEMEDASDTAMVEPYIYGNRPTKTDRLVFDAIKEFRITPEQFPNVYRWRHTVALHSPSEREKWPQEQALDEDSVVSCASPMREICAHSTPQKLRDASHDMRKEAFNNSAPNLQVSNWLRVTGPYSPRSALATKHVEHNVSFGF